MKLTVSEQMDKCVQMIKQLAEGKDIHPAVLMYVLTMSVSTNIDQVIMAAKKHTKESPKHKYLSKTLKAFENWQLLLGDMEDYCEHNCATLFFEERFAAETKKQGKTNDN